MPEATKEQLLAGTATMSAGQPEYRLERIALNRVDRSLAEEWTAFLDRCPSASPMHDPQWLDGHFDGEQSDIFVYLLRREETLCGVAVFNASDWPIKWHLGEIAVASCPVRRYRILGSEAHFPPDADAYRLLLRSLREETSFDALYLEGVALDSFLWKMIDSDPEVRRSFRRYQPDAPAPRVLLRLSGSFEDYMRKFSSKHRKNLRHATQKLEAAGHVRAVRVTQPEQVEWFVQQAVEISRKTYQWKLLGLGLRSPERAQQYFSFLARHGWLRSYLLLCQDTPTAFIIGFQYNRSYYLDDMGYDPAWRDYSVGKILQLRVVEDLFTEHRPEVYDMGEYGAHKEEFGTDQLIQGKVFLFRPGVYTGLVRTGHRACRAATSAASATLARLGLKKRLKKVIRIWSSEA